MPRGVNLYDEARLQGRLWTPDVLRGQDLLAQWIDVSDISTITVATGISQFRDKSGRGNHPGQVTAGNQSAYSPSGWKGFKACTIGNPGSVHAFNSNYPGSPSAGFFAVENNGSGGARTLIAHTGAGAVGFRINANKANLLRQQVLDVINGTVTIPTGFNVIGFMWETNYSAVSTNGFLESNSTNVSPTAHTTMYWYDAGSNLWEGKFGESVWLTARPSEQVRANIEGYLAWKWATVDNLIASHTFKNRPPLIGD
jgi:hypothetical protein